MGRFGGNPSGPKPVIAESALVAAWRPSHLMLPALQCLALST